MNDSDLKRLLKLIDANMSTNSGIYAGVDPRLSMRLNSNGEYEYVGLDRTYAQSAAELLQVSAFGGVAPDEDQIAAELFGDQASARHDTIAGHFVGSFAGWALEPELRAMGSSGGLTTWLLVELLRRGKVDGVIHMKPGGPANQLFSYQVSRSETEVRTGSKSRYYPGELSDVLREVRAMPGRYALVGIPSFIYEVRLLQRIDPLFKKRIPYLVGLICGHQKTANYAAYLAWRAGFSPTSLRAIDFRKKVQGQPANRYSTELHAVVDGVIQERVIPQSDLLGTDWGLGFFKSNFSDVTQDAFNETADIVFGDAWLPQYTPDGRGTNVVLVRDQRLLDLLSVACAEGRVHLEDLAISELVHSQAALVRQSITELPYRFRHMRQQGEQTPPVRRHEEASSITLSRRLTQRVRLDISRRSHAAFRLAMSEEDLSAFDRSMGPLLRRYRLAQSSVRAQTRFRKVLMRVRAWGGR